MINKLTSVGWPDHSLPWMSVIGVPIVGALPPVGIFREADVPVALPRPDDVALHVLETLPRANNVA